MKKVKIIPDTKEALIYININKATHNIPEWYKKSLQKIKGLENFSLIPNKPQTTTSTYKKCSPFLDQWNGLHIPDNCHNFVYKWENNFIIKTPKKYSTLFTHPHNRFDLPFYTLSGVVDTDRYVGPVQFPFFIKNNFTGVIKAGTPLAQMTFFKRERWFRKIYKDKKEYLKKMQFKFLSTIDRPYKNLFWEKKEYE